MISGSADRDSAAPGTEGSGGEGKRGEDRWNKERQEAKEISGEIGLSKLVGKGRERVGKE